MSLLSRLRVLTSLPLIVSELLIQVSELNSRLREANSLSRELIGALTSTTAATPETIATSIGTNTPISPYGIQVVPDPDLPIPRNPRRLRTDRDVHYTSQPLPRG